MLDRENAAVTIESGSFVTHILPNEVYAVTFDASMDLGPEQLPTNPSVSLIDAQSGTEVEGGAFLHAIPVVEQTIALGIQNTERGRRYELNIEFDHSPPRVEGEHSRKIHQIES